jgi:glycine dehydrogenase
MTRIDAAADFESRHVGSDPDAVASMLAAVGYPSLDALVDAVVPDTIRMSGDLDIPDALPEPMLLTRLRSIASKNRVNRSFLGMGYADTHVPGVIQRNILENPGWYTQYTPYQA